MVLSIVDGVTVARVNVGIYSSPLECLRMMGLCQHPWLEDFCDRVECQHSSWINWGTRSTASVMKIYHFKLSVEFEGTQGQRPLARIPIPFQRPIQENTQSASSFYLLLSLRYEDGRNISEPVRDKRNGFCSRALPKASARTSFLSLMHSFACLAYKS